ncbi:MAG: DUF5979 domain-containing protein [Eubacteriales bacterium]|nr:DUF5979 domain-containing protein [Eubacteriales bacterium]
MKKTLALILTFIMVLALVPSVAFAAEHNIVSVEIVDDIKTDGCLKLKVIGNDSADITNSILVSDYTITWKRGESEVKRVKVTGNEYNMADNGAWVNVAYDQGAQKTYTVTVSKDKTEITSVPMKVDWNDKLQNGSFEYPTVADVSDGSHVTVCWANDGTPAIQYIKQEKVPGWKTTVKTYTGEPTSLDIAHWIEIGNVAKQHDKGNPYNCNKAKHDAQVAELNAIVPGALYQDVLTVPTATMRWQVSHRGRLGDDTMALVIAPLSKVENLTEQTALIEYIKGKLNGAAEYNDHDGIFIKTFKSDNKEWGTYTGSYIVPDGQFATRYFFVAMDTHAGNLSCGNLLDDLDFETTHPLPKDGEGRLRIEKKIVGLSQEAANTLIANDFITYQVGTEAPQSAKLDNLTDDQNGGFTATFTTGITVPANGEVTVTVAEDGQKAAVNGYKLTVSGENQQTVTIKERETQVVSFTNTYESTQPPLDTGTLTVTKTVTGNEGDKNKDFTFTVTLKRPEITVDALATPIINATPGTSAAPTPVTETYEGVTFINGVATFTLKHNESKTIKGIPADMTYTVTESDNAGYTVTMSGNTGTIKAGETSTAAFNNYKAGDSGHSYYYPTATPVPVIVIPPKTGDMTVWQSILHFLGIR